MLSDYFPPHFGGGVEHVTSMLCKGLVQRNHTVFVMAVRTCPSPLKETDGGLTIRRIRGIDLTPRLGLQQTASIPVMYSIARAIHEFKPDIIHAHNLFFRTTEATALLKPFIKVPLVTTLHLGKLESEGRIFSTLVKIYESTMGNLIVRRSDHVIAVSNAVADHARSISHASTPVTVIPNGVDSHVFRPPRNGKPIGKTVLFVGRLISNKGPETLIKAIPWVLLRHPDTKFVFVGDGPLLDRLKTKVDQMDILHAVSFLGTRHDVPDQMRHATLFVRPSFTEGMPLTVLEAMASALPVIATPVGGTPELLKDSTCGHLVPVGDSSALANAIVYMLDNRFAAIEMGNRGRELVQDGYSWEFIVEQTERVYQEEINRR
ncbi:MAG: glycosyltransferase family 4 protein [Chloroflexi bacterium]|nr:glycosyltransferase family 4 protein [Chloroflexota bacterium]